MQRNALITGGTRGIGYATAERLISENINVTITGTTENNKGPKGSEYICADFTDMNSVTELVSYISTNNIDILINNAGINKIGKFAELDVDDFDRIIKVNLKVPFMLCQAAIPYMQENKWGRIINITSIFGHITKEYRAPYSSSKFGLDGMTAALAAEVSQYGILANCIGPGFVDTDLTRTVLGDKGIADLKEKIPIKRLAKANEIASAIAWLVSDENTYMAGQNILIDGGFSRV